jgi:hypothetical protein
LVTWDAAWLEEFRLYHREAGKIIKVNDDVIPASRYATMMRRFASTRPRPGLNLRTEKDDGSFVGLLRPNN